jgi:hypothetical protein
LQRGEIYVAIFLGVSVLIISSVTGLAGAYEVSAKEKNTKLIAILLCYYVGLWDCG